MATSRHYLACTTLVPIALIRPDSWRERAACAGHSLGPQTWDDSIPNETDVQRAARITRAQEVCAGCPVSVPCLADIDRRFDEGVRGGVDLRELYRSGKRGAA